MKEYKPIDPNISFADAALISFDFKDDNQILNVFLKAWNEKIIKLSFESVLYFQYNSGDFILDIYEYTGVSSIVKNALIKEFNNKIPPNHNYKLILINDIYDFSIIKIVCAGLIFE